MVEIFESIFKFKGWIFEINSKNLIFWSFCKILGELTFFNTRNSILITSRVFIAFDYVITIWYAHLRALISVLIRSWFFLKQNTAERFDSEQPWFREDQSWSLWSRANVSHDLWISVEKRQTSETALFSTDYLWDFNPGYHFLIVTRNEIANYWYLGQDAFRETKLMAGYYNLQNRCFCFIYKNGGCVLPPKYFKHEQFLFPEPKMYVEISF